MPTEQRESSQHLDSAAGRSNKPQADLASMFGVPSNGELMGRQALMRVEPGGKADAVIPGLIGTSAPMRTMAAEIKRSASTDFAVLVIGESGTGKELVATSIHDHSRRAKRPFVAVNCGAIPEGLIESELFGHVKGSFTGALSDKRGLFVEADGGTLFLDEIGEMTPAVQVKLLRALQEKEVLRVGSARPVKVDVRVIAATNRDLAAMVRDGGFREDLYYRLSVLEIRTPALRDRREDIPLLAMHFLEKSEKELSLKRCYWIEESALEMLSSYDWPGNVRQLENIMQRLVVKLEDESAITVESVREVFRHLKVGPDPGQLVPERSRCGRILLPQEVLEFREGETTRSYMSRVKLHLFETVLASHEDRNVAARRLGVSVSAMKKGLRRLRLRAGGKHSPSTEGQSINDQFVDNRA